MYTYFRKISCSICALLLFQFGFSQITVELGSQDETNTFFGPEQYPCVYATGENSVKHQMLVRASEIIGAGGVQGNFLSIAFNVGFADTFEDMDEFTIRVGHTNLDELDEDFETGLTTVFGPFDYTSSNGWNVHAASNLFEWDGSSNLIVETCFLGFGTAEHSLVWRSNTPFASTLVAEPGGGGPGGGNACAQDDGDAYFSRPDMRLVIDPTELPPLAQFSASTLSTCSGLVSFTDLSDFNPTSWEWHFGDGNMSNEQNPTHTYMADGTYTVTLIVTNDLGTDTLEIENMISVALSSDLPVSPFCVPNENNGNLGFGITSLQLNTINNTSLDAQVPYEDFTCLNTTLTEGANYDLILTAAGAANSFVNAWLDYNNDGAFTNDEILLSEQFQGTQSFSVSIQNGGVLDTPLRLRVVADFFQNGSPTACGPYASGQAEDYAIFIEENTMPPAAAFEFDPSISCDGEVQFLDMSTNLPSSWLWDFGDTETSFLQNPSHTYASSGTYDVTLTVFNAAGSDMITINSAITVDLDQALVDASCTPSAATYCCEYGILNYSFNDIDNDSEDGSEGYRDFSCSVSTELFENEAISYSIATGGTNLHDTRIWVDFNNDGSFTEDELIIEELNTSDPSGSYTFNGSPLLETKLRMRVSSDVVGATLDGCSNNTFGQTEDYGIVIHPALMPPIPDFEGFPLYSCDGVVDFEDLSGNSPDSWLWNFGDGEESNEQDPQHIYQNLGTYNVSLTVSNDDGTETLTFNSYVVVDFSLPCNIESLAESTADESNECQGMLLDSGEFFDYENDSDQSFTIDISGIPGTNIIQLSFLEFAFSFPDVLSIYDGPNTSSPLIGTYTGGTFPNGGQVISSGNTITIAEETNAASSNDGFVLTWDCINVGLIELPSMELFIQPNPSQGEISIVSDTYDWTNAQLEVFDMNGKVVHEQGISQNGLLYSSIDLSFLETGVYQIRIWDEQRFAVRKLMID
ncbi:MAG: PKD domain-containing protein [Bacteroidota bacterium]